jgi:hypothetical protein
MLLARGCSSKRRLGDGGWCRNAEYQEVPIVPLQPCQVRTVRHGVQRHADGVVAKLAAPECLPTKLLKLTSHGPTTTLEPVLSNDYNKSPIPLRFWIGSWLSLVVLAVMTSVAIAFTEMARNELHIFANQQRETISNYKKSFQIADNLPSVCNQMYPRLDPETLKPHPTSLCHLQTVGIQLQKVDHQIEEIKELSRFVTTQLSWLDWGITFAEDNVKRVRPALYGAIFIAASNEMFWKYRAWQRLHAVANLAPEERGRWMEPFDFYTGFYFIPVAAFNAACAFLVLALVWSIFLLTFLSPVLFDYLWKNLFLGIGIGSIVWSSVMYHLRNSSLPNSLVFRSD